ncbi:hypothetical protein HW260_08090 [Helicobacter cinaedi]|uniref:Uncharacterized protein n=1 Tax=Helicobacter cinaedi CCUG 18818 = ATCC BAA-847 TaxID=537971 RepID=A0ABN0BC50_9HELI|nr:hypothetical protein [Helicobacter cinaedi]EFR47243.1 hypothetical protein HCCG_01791 [Helicobacter cinaedi CCUG 18818 = ATCC BAA-847]QOQ90210.1 hypothetical protein HW260_08090 [Helicobacter cinaedi]
MRKIYENPSLKSSVLYTKILNSGSEKETMGRYYFYQNLSMALQRLC